MRRLALALLSALLLGVTADAAPRRCGDDVDGHTVPCDCGDILVNSRTLGDDDPITSRVCEGAGLLVDVPADRRATLALAGHVLAGSRRGPGIHVLRGGRDGLTITGPGAVRGFYVGLMAPGGSVARVAQVTAADNAADGFSVVGAGYAIEDCEAVQNGRDGFALRGSGFRLEGSRALANGRHGFVLAGRDAAVGGTAGNEAAGNGRDGVRLRGRGHDVQAPVATANGGRGIRAHVATGRIAGAVASANRRAGLRAAGSHLTLTGNRVDDCRGPACP